MNAIILKKGTEQILYVIRDAELRGNAIIGTNQKLIGIDFGTVDVRWTENDVREKKQTILSPRGKRVQISVPDVKLSDVALGVTAPKNRKELLMEKTQNAQSTAELREVLLTLFREGE